MPTERGRLIVLDGGEGTGKTSIIARLKKDGMEAVFSREPGGTKFGEAARALLVHGDALNMDPLATITFWNTMRIEHIAKIVQPALVNGQNVVLDRFWSSTWAYQWANLPTGEDGLFMGHFNPRSLVQFLDYCVRAPRIISPDFYIWLDVDPAAGLARRKGTGDTNDIDLRDIDFHKRVCGAYADLFRANTETHWAVANGLGFKALHIDANREQSVVYDDVSQAINAFLATKTIPQPTQI